MKSLWIRVEAHEIGSKRIGQLAERLGIPDAYALGLYVALGGAVAEHAPDGVIADVPDRKIEQWGMWQGRAGKFAGAVRELLQDDRGELVEWRESMGKLVEQREKDRARKGAGNSEEPPRTIAGNSVVTERNGTERNVTERNDSASSSLHDSSNKRSGDLSADAVRAPAPPVAAADAEEPDLPREAEELLVASFPDASVRERKRRELRRTLTTGARYRGHVILAYSPRRLAEKCQEVLDNPPRDPSKALAVLYTKLADTSDGSAPGAVAAAEERHEQQRSEAELTRELIDANAWLEEHGDIAGEVDRELFRSGFPAPDPDTEPIVAKAYAIARDNLVRRFYRQRASEPAHAG